MASRTLDTDIIQVRTVFARTPQNGFIPSSHILISNGDSSTRWNSVSSIFEVSSFKTVIGNSTSTFSADLSHNILRISTTGVQGILESYVDNQTLMLSNYLPPYAVSLGSVPSVSLPAATNVPNAEFLTPVTGQSTLKFLGVGDIQFSTITSQKAMFVSISTFTSVGYSTISGETFSLRPTLYSTLSTSYGRPSFISSIPFVAGANGWNVGSNLLFSTPSDSRDMYFSSITFQMGADTARYIDVTKTSSSRIFIDYNPALILSTMIFNSADRLTNPMLPILAVSSFIQIENNLIPRQILPESVTTTYMTSQQVQPSQLSNYFNTPMRFEIDPYTSFLSNYTTNNTNTLNFTIYHRFLDARAPTASDTGFSSISSITNITPSRGGLYMNLINQSPTF